MSRTDRQSPTRVYALFSGVVRSYKAMDARIDTRRGGIPSLRVVCKDLHFAFSACFSAVQGPSNQKYGAKSARTYTLRPAVQLQHHY
jgi:hypothetical protein